MKQYQQKACVMTKTNKPKTMRKSSIVVALTALALVMYSCKKDKDSTEITKEPVYSQFKAGTYWVYRLFTVDSAGNATATDIYDSCYVMKDTVINNFTYVKSYRGTANLPFPKYDYSRDSLNYVVALNGSILFSTNDFETAFVDHYSITPDNDTLYRVVKKMTDKDLSVTMPAGAFVTSNCRETYTMYLTNPHAPNPRYKHNKYSGNIGIVCETLPFFTSSTTTTERRLARYHIVL
jgi:hypothetical protein